MLAARGRLEAQCGSCHVLLLLPRPAAPNVETQPAGLVSPRVLSQGSERSRWTGMSLSHHERSLSPNPSPS